MDDFFDQVRLALSVREDEPDADLVETLDWAGEQHQSNTLSGEPQMYGELPYRDHLWKVLIVLVYFDLIDPR